MSFREKSCRLELLRPPFFLVLLQGCCGCVFHWSLGLIRVAMVLIPSLLSLRAVCTVVVRGKGKKKKGNKGKKRGGMWGLHYESSACCGSKKDGTLHLLSDKQHEI